MTYSKVGVILVNLGTPSSTRKRDIRAFLRPFLKDPFVIDVARPLWLTLLNGFILPFRPRKIQHLYKNIWREDGSPLLVYTKRLAEKLQLALSDNEETKVLVRMAMAYSVPGISEVVADLIKNQVEKLIILPTFPQCSSTTTAPILSAFAQTFRHHRKMVPFDFICGYHDNVDYIRAVAETISLAEDELLLFSFHGIPEKYRDLGDDYPKQCQETAARIAQEAGLADHQWRVTFQSRFGRAPWLQPYTDKTLQAVAQSEYQKVAVVCPGFAVDCLETLEEINITNRQLFFDSGGKAYRYIPALNDSDEQVQMLARLIAQYL